MSLLSSLKAWREQRRIARLWPLSSMVERLGIMLDCDARWLANSRIASELIARYQTMIRPNWYQLAAEDISALRRRLDLDPWAHGYSFPSGTLTRAQIDQMTVDAMRFQWLTEDHDDSVSRARRDEILRRMPVMSYSATCTEIDNAMHEAMEREAIAADPTPSAP